jgi:hypothetical protein
VSIGNRQQTLQYARPTLITTSLSDVDTPFSYQDWYRSHSGIIPGQEYKQYNEYLVEWYKDKSRQVTDQKLQIKLNYLTLLKQLQIFFSNEEIENWYNNVNVENEKELLLAIPYFARKLKEISLYYFKLRESVKQSKLRYNLAGSNFGITQELQKFILLNYTQKPSDAISLPASIWKNVPELSSIKDTIGIQIEELYDSQNYLDHSSTVPVSAYYDLTNTDLANFLSTKNLNLTSTDWVYKLGIYPLSADYLYLSGGDLSELSLDLSEKYLGGDIYTSFSSQPSTQADFYALDIEQGNNSFFWPYGVYNTYAKTLPIYEPVALSSLDFSTFGTAGSSLENADTIFVKTTRGTQGAWLRRPEINYQDVNMLAELQASSKTAFIFPYPGYGLSAEDIEWTGYELVSDPRYSFLGTRLQQAIQEAYWSNQTELTATKITKINDTTLTDNKAYPNSNFSQADKIRIWSVPPNYTDGSFSGEQKEAWLYRFNKTDISVKANSDSTIVWPYEKIDPTQDYPNYYPENISNICTPLSVSDIDFIHATAGDALSSADVIYKLTNYKDTIEDATECCWLSGKALPIPGSNIIATQQPSFQGLFKSGTYNRFIWNGPNNTDANTVFRSINHQPDCKFASTPNTSYTDFNLCTCNSVLFTPLGHPGNTYTDNQSFTDFIIQDDSTAPNIDLSSWTDQSGTTYQTSSAFAWFKTNTKIGWGDGRWYSGSNKFGNNLLLQNGKQYIYFRTSVRTKDKEEVILPDLIARYSIQPSTNSNFSWIKATKSVGDTTTTWVNSNEPSNMVLTPGDILIYSRKETSSYSLTSAELQPIDVSENRGSIWTSFDYISIGPDKSFVLSYPYETYTDPAALNAANPAYPQYPAYNLNSNIVSILQWSLSAPGLPLQYFKNQPSVLITPTLTGLYIITVTAMTSEVLPPRAVALSSTFYYLNTGLYTFTNIPPVTAIPNIELVQSLTGYNTPVPGFVLNTPLKGWDYNRGVATQYTNPRFAGARPFWAKTYLDKDLATEYKGIESWGTPLRLVDDHNVVSQPEISDIELETGTRVEYTRNYPTRVYWNQPIQLQAVDQSSKWCTLNFNTTSTANIASLLNNSNVELVVTPTTATSNLVLENLVDNQPVEVSYNALNSFTWNITAVPQITTTSYRDISANLAIQASAPWANLTNQNFPTVAAFPYVGDNLYSVQDSGGYSTPNNLGATVYVDKDYTTSLNLTSETLLQYFQDKNKRVDGRGLAKQDIPTPYTEILENNIWLKEPIVAGPIAGIIKKSVFKKYQKFLPYQSGVETNSRLKIGLLTPVSRQSPWTGKEDSTWGDIANKPTTFTGEVDIDKWAQSQVLKQNNLQVDNWVTDVYGNQYGLYKDIRNIPSVNRKDALGEVWVRDNAQRVRPAYLSLSAVFDTYTNTNLINELTGINGIKKIDVFFDTLFIQTTGSAIFEKLSYDYDTDNIFSISDNARYISLAMPVSTSFIREFANTNFSGYTFAKVGETWFFPQEKIVIISVCGYKDDILTPELYSYDLYSLTLKKVFPVTSGDTNTLQSLSSVNLFSINEPLLSHNTFKREYLFVISGKGNNSEDILIEINIKDLPQLEIDTISVYSSLSSSTIFEPPALLHDLSVTLEGVEQTEVLTISGNNPLVTIAGEEIIAIVTLDTLNFQCTATSAPVTYTPISLPSWVTLSETGLFEGTPPLLASTYLATFTVNNAIGPTYYSLNITVR